MSVMIVLVKLVGCILLVGVCCCDVAWSQSHSESCTNRSIEYADCISRAELSSSAICNGDCFGPVLFYYRDCVSSSRATDLQEDCTRNIYGRLCSQLSYFLPFECIGGVGCDDECEDELRQRYGCCARSKFASSLQSVAPFCHLISPCPLPSSGRAVLNGTGTLLLALIIATGANLFSTLPR